MRADLVVEIGVEVEVETGIDYKRDGKEVDPLVEVGVEETKEAAEREVGVEETKEAAEREVAVTVVDHVGAAIAVEAVAVPGLLK